MSIRYFSFYLLLLSICSLTDPSSFSNYDQIKQTKVKLNININFEEKIIDVEEKLYMKAEIDGEVIVLDTNQIEILSIIDSDTGDSLPYKLDYLHSIKSLGTPLKIYKTYKKGDIIVFVIKCKSSKSAEGIQFLKEEQTFGRKYPYMYTQGQSIFVRTMFPIQDSPEVKLTVDASLTIPKPLVGVYSGIYQSQIDNGQTTTFF